MRKILPLFSILILVCLFLFLADHFDLISPIRGVIQKPILGMEEKIFEGHQGFLRIMESLDCRDKTGEIVRLEGKLRQLASDQNQFATCLEENERLKKLLGAPLPPKWKFILARVTGLGSQMRIDKGKKDGVKEGMMVVSENILVGKVLSVGEFASRVQRIDDIRTKIPVVVKKPAGGGIQARGLLLGQGGGIILDRVLQSEDIQKGDLVVSSGEADWLPDLLIAQIEEVLPKSAEVYQKARLLPLVDYQKLKIVFVVVR